jgi:hypothetical protein
MQRGLLELWSLDVDARLLRRDGWPAESVLPARQGARGDCARRSSYSVCASTITRAASRQPPPLACHKDGSKRDHNLLLVPPRVHLKSYRIVKTMILNLKADGTRIR